MNQELSLLPLVNIRVSEVRVVNRAPVDLLQLIARIEELTPGRAGVGRSECPLTLLSVSPVHHLMHVRNKMKDRILPSTIGEFGMIRPMDDV